MSTDPENEYFSDGITDDIIAQLSKISALKVISRTSSMQYKKTTKKITAIAQELGVGAILEGSVRKAGQRVRIVVHLVEPGSEKHLWGDTFDRQLTDIFEVQSEVAQQITGALSLALSPEEKQRVEKKATSDVDAYNLYLLGRFHANKWAEADVLKAIECFQGAIAKDPGYAVAYAGLADAYELLSIGFSSKPPVVYLAQAKAMALKALEMDDSLAEAHTSLAYARWLGDLDWPGAEREFKRAIELKTSYVMAHEWYAEYLAALGRHDEAFVQIKRAQQLDPLAVPVNRAVGWVLYFARRYDQAIDELQKTLAMNPDFLGARMVLWWVWVAKGAYAGGDRRHPAGSRAPRTPHREEADAGIRLRRRGEQGRGQRDPLGAGVQAGGRGPVGPAVGAPVHGAGHQGSGVPAAAPGIRDSRARTAVSEGRPLARPPAVGPAIRRVGGEARARLSGRHRAPE